MGREKHQGVWKDALHRPTPAIPASTMRARNEPKVNGRRANCPNGSAVGVGRKSESSPRHVLPPQHAASSWGADAGEPRRCRKQPGERQAPSGDQIGAFVVGPSHDFPTTFPGPSRDLPEAVAVSILRIRPYAPGGPSPGSGAKASGRHGCLGQSDPIGDAQRNGRIVEVVTGIVQPRADAVAQHDEGAGSIAEHV